MIENFVFFSSNYRIFFFFLSVMSSSLIEIHKNKIVHFFNENMSSSTIAIIKNVSRRIIEKIQTNLKMFEIHISSKLKKMNKSIKITSTMQIELKFFLKIKSWTYLKKMKLYLFNNFDVVVFVFTIFDCFKYQMKINRQIMKKFFLKKSQICRNVYMFRINEFNSDQLMFLNESAVNEHIMNRKYDWLSFEIFF